MLEIVRRMLTPLQNRKTNLLFVFSKEVDEVVIVEYDKLHPRQSKKRKIRPFL